MEYVNQLLSIAENFSVLLYFLAFLFAASEATLGISMLLPGSLIVMLIGALAGLGYVNIYYVLLLAIFGAVLGDNIGYFLGHKFGRKLLDKIKFIDKSTILAGERFIQKHGAKSVMLGRFVPFVKETVPFLAGALKMNRKKFMLYNFLGAVGWSAMWPGMGYFFAKAVLSGNTWIGSTQIVLALIFLLYLIYLAVNEFKVADKIRFKILEAFKSKVFFRILGIILLLYSVFSYIAILVIESSYKIYLLDKLGLLIYESFNVFAFLFFLFFTYSAKWFVLFPLLTILSVWVFYKYRADSVKYLISLWSTLIFASAFVVVLKHAIARPRPDFAHVHVDGYAFPSGHATLAMALSAILIFLLTRFKIYRKRFIIYLAIVLWATLIMISRIYLGVHYMSDIVGGIIIGLIAATLGVSVYLWIDNKESSNTRFSNYKNKDMPMRIYSTAFENAGFIPSKFTCDGKNINPELVFENVPEGAKSLVLIMDDPDVPERVREDRHFTHWLLYNLPADIGRITENSVSGTQGKNDAGQNAYIGPCPPVQFEPTEHRYFFKLYALDKYLDLPKGLNQRELEDAIEGHIIEKAEFYGVYDRAK